jgi:hypothetical protein
VQGWEPRLRRGEKTREEGDCVGGVEEGEVRWILIEESSKWQLTVLEVVRGC